MRTGMTMSPRPSMEKGMGVTPNAFGERSYK